MVVTIQVTVFWCILYVLQVMFKTFYGIFLNVCSYKLSNRVKHRSFQNNVKARFKFLKKAIFMSVKKTSTNLKIAEVPFSCKKN